MASNNDMVAPHSATAQRVDTQSQRELEVRRPEWARDMDRGVNNSLIGDIVRDNYGRSNGGFGAPRPAPSAEPAVSQNTNGWVDAMPLVPKGRDYWTKS